MKLNIFSDLRKSGLAPGESLSLAQNYVFSFGETLIYTTSRDFWSSRNDRKSLSQENCVLRKCCGGISEMVNARALKPVPLCSAPLKTY